MHLERVEKQARELFDQMMPWLVKERKAEGKPPWPVEKSQTMKAYIKGWYDAYDWLNDFTGRWPELKFAPNFNWEAVVEENNELRTWVELDSMGMARRMLELFQTRRDSDERYLAIKKELEELKAQPLRLTAPVALDMINALKKENCQLRERILKGVEATGAYNPDDPTKFIAVTKRLPAHTHSARIIDITPLDINS